VSIKRFNGAEDFWIRAIIYGAPGVGKTTLAATAPKPFFWMCDPQGGLSIATSGHPYWEIKEQQEHIQAWTWMTSHMDEWETLIIDTLTHFQDLGMDLIQPPGVLTLDRRDWGKSGRQMRNTLKSLLKFEKHIVFLCDERLRDNEITRLKVVVPDLPPAQLRFVNRNARIVGRLAVEPKLEKNVRVLERRLQLYNDGRVWGKDTSGKLPPSVVDEQLNLTWLFDVARGRIQLNQGESEQ